VTIAPPEASGCAPPEGFGLPAAAGDHVQIGPSPPSVMHMITVGAAPYAQLVNLDSRTEDRDRSADARLPSG
jgi:hypothetical protein